MMEHAPQLFVASLLGIALVLSLILYVTTRRAKPRSNESSR
jgi:hypothetical protein